MVCPNCSFLNQADAKTCANCGYSLEASVPPPPTLIEAGAPAAVAAPLTPAPAPAAPAYPVAAPKSKSTALILEILPGIFGFLGFGWIYVGQTQRGILTLVGYFALTVISAITIALTVGLGCLVCLPLMWGVIAFSAYQLNIYSKAHLESITP